MRPLEWLRPLVETNAWDYCIVWQFGDDPSRFIEWIGCCCNGSHQDVCRNIKKDIHATKQHFTPLCRDTYVKHYTNSIACEKLATIPFYLPLYSGIHGEVAMSGQSSWSYDTVGTQVLIPVNGGLIELYKSKQVPRDQEMIEMIETLTTEFNKFSLHECFPVDDTKDKAQLKVEGSPNGENPWSENSSHVSPGSSHVSPTKSTDKPNSSQITAGNELYISKNLLCERKRRNRIKDSLFALRALVPKISKMDRLSIVGDAIEFIKELQANVQRLEHELEELEEDDSKPNVDEVEVCKPKRAYEHSPTMRCSRFTTASDRKTEVQVEIHQIGAKSFLVKLVSGQTRGGVRKIMEIVDSLGLQVLDINVTTCYGRVLNILKVEAKGKEVAAKSLKESLLKSWMSRTYT